jgi:hypothetical protein
MSGSGSHQVHPDSEVQFKVPVLVGAAIRTPRGPGGARSWVTLGALDGPEKNLALAAVMVGLGAGQRVMRQGRVTESNARWVREGGEEPRRRIESRLREGLCGRDRQYVKPCLIRRCGGGIMGSVS